MTTILKPKEMMVFEALCDAVDGGEPCPSNRQISSMLGLVTEVSGSLYVGRLEEKGLIAVERESSSSTITILSRDVASPRAKGFAKIRGRLPRLEYVSTAELQIDPQYQRSVSTGASQSLITRIAREWNWDLCQPLVVSHRSAGELFVIDGQHRWEAAQLRGDIEQLPCTIVRYPGAAEEAAAFVNLNKLRRPLSKLEVFKASLASGDRQSVAIHECIERAGPTLAPHENAKVWKPGMIANIGGLERVWRVHGPEISYLAMRALRQAYEGLVIRYAGTLYPGLAAVCADEMRENGEFLADRFDAFCALVGDATQAEWRKRIASVRADLPNLRYASAAEVVMRRAWNPENLAEEETGSDDDDSARFAVPPQAREWCAQCDMMISASVAAGCKSPFCSLRKAA